jgi:hypothetical protein
MSHPYRGFTGGQRRLRRIVRVLPWLAHPLAISPAWAPFLTICLAVAALGMLAAEIVILEHDGSAETHATRSTTHRERTVGLEPPIWFVGSTTNWLRWSDGQTTCWKSAEGEVACSRTGDP